VSSLAENIAEWTRDLRFIEQVDGIVLRNGFGDLRTRARRTMHGFLAAFDEYGLDMRGSVDPQWQAAALRTVDTSRIKGPLLAAANQLRLASVKARDDTLAWDRPTTILLHDRDPAIAAVYRENWAGRHRDGVVALQKALLCVTDAMEASSLALSAEEMGQPEMADETIERLLLARPAEYGLLVTRGRLAELRRAEARVIEEVFRAVVAANPERVPGWAFLARTLVAHNDPRAEPLCRNALERFPGHPVLQWLQGEAFIQLGDDRAARECFERVVETDPGLTDAWERLLQLVSDPAVALPMLRRAIKSSPTHAPLAQRLAQCLLATGGAAQVEAVLLPCVGESWRTDGLYRLLAEATEVTERFAKASLYWRVAAFFGDTEALLDRGESLLRAGDSARAREQALRFLLRVGEQGELVDRAFAVVLAAERKEGRQPDRAEFAQWLWRDGPEPPGAARCAERAWRAESADPPDRTSAALHWLDHLLAWGEHATSVDLLQTTAALLSEAGRGGDQSPAWVLAAAAVEQMEVALAAGSASPVSLFLEAQMWTGQDALRLRFEQVLTARRGGQRLVGSDAQAADIVDRLIRLRDRARPR
jgi:tetratricopeptide (TPR) repeat protein